MEARRLTIPRSFPFYALVFLLLISKIQTTTVATFTTSKSNSLKIYKKFIQTSCNATTYPSLCYKYLSSYSSSIKTDSLNLCKTALVLNLKAASNTSSLLRSIRKKGLNPSEKAVTNDCIEEIDGCTDELTQASNVMRTSRRSDLEYRMDDIKTWVSAAITDEDTCTDGFDGLTIRTSVKNSMRKSVVKLGKVTSNTLALINSLRY